MFCFKGVIREESKAVRTKGKVFVNLKSAKIHKNDDIFAQSPSSKVCEIFSSLYFN